MPSVIAFANRLFLGHILIPTRTDLLPLTDVPHKHTKHSHDTKHFKINMNLLKNIPWEKKSSTNDMHEQYDVYKWTIDLGFNISQIIVFFVVFSKVLHGCKLGWQVEAQTSHLL